jgi:DNA replication protein DnaC
MDYEGEVKNSLTLIGETGVGKSGMMACIARAAIQRGAPPLWVDALEFIEAIRKTYDDDKAANAAALIESAQRCPLLCFDDLGDMRLRGKMGQPGFGEASDHTREKIYSVIRYRYENEMPTVITSNLTQAQMYAQFGHRITDRIREMSHVVTVGGKNLRFGE